MPQTILLIEDKQANRNAIKRMLRESQLYFLEAGNGQEALDILAAAVVDAILLDLSMPVMDGYAFLEHMRSQARYASIPVCVMTGWPDSAYWQKALDMGADDFMRKPAEKIELEARIKLLLRLGAQQRRLHEYEQATHVRHQVSLPALAGEGQPVHHSDSRSPDFREMILRMAMVADYRESPGMSHLHRIGCYTALMARKLDWPEEEVEDLMEAAKLCDIGKIALPDGFLSKKGVITEKEKSLLQRCPEIGASLLAGSESKLLQMAEVIAYSCHENFDGSGFPRGLLGEDIPVASRIVAIARDFEALMNGHSQRRQPSLAAVMSVMQKEAGHRYDPRLVALFLGDQESLLDIYRRYPESGVELRDAQLNG